MSCRTPCIGSWRLLNPAIQIGSPGLSGLWPCRLAIRPGTRAPTAKPASHIITKATVGFLSSISPQDRKDFVAQRLPVQHLLSDPVARIGLQEVLAVITDGPVIHNFGAGRQAASIGSEFRVVCSIWIVTGPCTL